MLDRDPDNPINSPNNVCSTCRKPWDDHCFKHFKQIRCPDSNGKAPCEMTGPKGEISYA